MIHCEATIEIDKPPEAVFAFVDDAAQSPRWVGMCQTLEVLGPLPKRVGTKLRYSYKQGGAVRAMEGTVTGYEPPRRIEMTFTDKGFRIVVAYHVEHAVIGTGFRETIDIEAKLFFAKLMAPLMRAATRRQIAKDVAKLKELLESP